MVLILKFRAGAKENNQVIDLNMFCLGAGSDTVGRESVREYAPTCQVIAGVGVIYDGHKIGEKL